MKMFGVKMKQLLRSTLITLAISMTLISSSHLASAAENKVVTLHVPGMNCKFCPITVRKALKKVPGVVEATVNLESKTATVKYDSTKVNVDVLTKATADAGYPSSENK